MRVGRRGIVVLEVCQALGRRDGASCFAEGAQFVEEHEAREVAPAEAGPAGELESEEEEEEEEYGPAGVVEAEEEDWLEVERGPGAEEGPAEFNAPEDDLPGPSQQPAGPRRRQTMHPGVRLRNELGKRKSLAREPQQQHLPCPQGHLATVPMLWNGSCLHASGQHMHICLLQGQTWGCGRWRLACGAACGSGGSHSCGGSMRASCTTASTRELYRLAAAPTSVLGPSAPKLLLNGALADTCTYCPPLQDAAHDQGCEARQPQHTLAGSC